MQLSWLIILINIDKKYVRGRSYITWGPRKSADLQNFSTFATNVSNLNIKYKKNIL